MMFINTVYQIFFFFWYLPSGLGCNQFHNCLFEKKMHSPDVGSILYTFTRPGLLIVCFGFFVLTILLDTEFMTSFFFFFKPLFFEQFRLTAKLRGMYRDFP